MATSEEATWVISADIPDPDNFLMILSLLKSARRKVIKRPVPVILTPRPVDFRAAPYGRAYDHLLRELNRACADEPDYQAFPTGVRRLITAMTEDGLEDAPSWISKLDEADQPWFYVDKQAHNKQMQEDTKLYMKVSVLRLVKYLEGHEIQSGEYQLYWDEASMQKLRPGMRHAYHVPDFAWGFGFGTCWKYQKAIDNNIINETGNVKEAQSEELGFSIRLLCNSYIEEERTQRRQDGKILPELLLGSVDDLIQDLLYQNDALRFFVGGPFTEVLKVVKSLPTNASVLGMGGFIHGRSNVFANQFNFLVDMESANEFLDMADAGQIDLTLLPTECVKASPYALPGEELKDVLKKSPESLLLYKQYESCDTDDDMMKRTYNPFDWVLALLADRPELLMERTVKKIAGPVIRFEENRDGNIKMLWNDKDYQMRHKASYLQGLRDTFEIDKSF